MNKRPLMLTRYEVSCLRRAVADWGMFHKIGLSPREKAASTRLYTALYELGDELREQVRVLTEALMHCQIAMRTIREYVPDSRQYLSIELLQQVEAALSAGEDKP